MPVEVELKAHVRDRNRVLRVLDQLATAETATYQDTYYDTPEGALARAGKEFRARTIHVGDQQTLLLTFKEPKLDSSGQPEHEVVVAADPNQLSAILTGLGYVPVIAFTKLCTNYRLTRNSSSILATVVQLPEIGDKTYIEVECVLSVAEEPHIASTAETLRSFMIDVLGLDEATFTDDTYTGAVRKHRDQQ